MITIKLPYICTDDSFKSSLLDLRRLQSSYLRSAYQLFNEGLKQKEVQQNKELHTKFDLGCWFKQSALMEAKGLFAKSKGKKFIFGGKHNLIKRLKNEISNDQWKAKRLSNLKVQGESLQKGNRHFDLDIEHSSIIFKPGNKVKFTLQLPNLKANYIKKLTDLQLKTSLKEQPFQVELNEDFIYISFDEVKEPKPKVIENRYLGIDLNPSNIGCSIIETLKDGSIKVIAVREYSVKVLIDKIKALNVASSSPLFKGLNNKLNFETIQIAKHVNELAKEYHCKGIFIEDLSFKDKTGDFKGHSFNRLTKNLWKRETFSSNLKKRCTLSGLTFYEVSPMYSSVIGNLMYDYTDPINASIEIARRGAQVIFEKEKQKRKFYPEFKISSLKYQWKEQFSECKDWKEIFLQIKNSKMKYRVSLPIEQIGRVFSLNCVKSFTFYHNCSFN